MNRARLLLLASTLSLALMTCGCGSGDARTAETRSTSLAQVEIEFPQGDPSVSADQGGPGFRPDNDSGWQTNDTFELEGSPEAVKGGSVRFWVGGFPNTLRIVGKDSNRLANGILRDLCYESLLERHSDSLEFIPRLATHWWISEDKRTFRYRINPRAHWSDGKPVTAADVVATWDLLMDQKILDPAKQVIYGKFERPRALSKYLVEVRAQAAGWRNFLNFSTMAVFPAHELADLDGATFLREYQFRTLAGSGPYLLRDVDVKRGQHVTLRRRPDYWAGNERFAVGRYNFDAIRLVTTEDYNLGLEKAKKGEIDIFRIGRAKEWAVDLPRLQSVERGLLLMRRIDNDEPLGVSGIVMNMRVPPLDDVRVRQALCHLFHREKLIDKLFYGQYRPINSYFPGGNYKNEDNPAIEYDPDRAARLLAQAGWSERDAEGVLVKDGRRFELELVYSSKAVERYLSIFQEDCLKAGVQVHLKQLTRAARFQITHGDRRFQLATEGWGGLIDPNPETKWFATLADQPNNSNLAGFKDPQVDELCRRYEQSFDVAERVELIRQVDALIFRQYPCILGWSNSAIRLAYWNKFGRPDWYLGRTAGAHSVLAVWWVDPSQEAELKRARKDSSMRLDPGEQDVAYWTERGAHVAASGEADSDDSVGWPGLDRREAPESHAPGFREAPTPATPDLSGSETGSRQQGE